jgi:hypothetical protein
VREKLNESKAAQVGLVAVLAVIVAVLFLGHSGGGSSAETPAEAPLEATGAIAVSASTGGMGELPTSVPATGPLPRRFTAAYESGATVALLVVHDGGIDDRYTKEALGAVSTDTDVEAIVVPARQISRYASITVGLDVGQLPALIVMRPKKLSGGTPQASVAYGVQTPQSIHQMIADASYEGPEGGTYHPE